MPLFGYTDYFDYYRKEGSSRAAYAFKQFEGTISSLYRYESHKSINYITSYGDLFGSSMIQRNNPAINEGDLSSFTMIYERGEGAEAFGVVGADNVKFEIEQSFKILGSDWDYTRFNVDI